jgi:nucleotide-binding universal stress UspA family protein
MRKILLAVDGSESAVRATRFLIESLSLYKETPQVDVLTVHRALPNVGSLGSGVTKQTRDAYYNEEFDVALAPSTTLLDAAKVQYTVHRLIGPVAETIVNTAAKLGSSLILMGSRGHTGIANLVIGSIATQVLHVSNVPVQLVR